MSSLVRSVNRSIRALASPPEDEALTELARAYARIIDEHPDELVKLGPKLKDTLVALGMSPGGRARAGKGKPTDAKRTNPLDELRQRRADRQH
jgi:hypothetical protein